jgi:HD-like signal output (HDOD) protein
MIPDASDDTTRASGSLESYVGRLLGGRELPMFSRRLLELLTLSNQEQTSAQQLAGLVLEDYSLTFKVLRIVNSVHYNRSNRPIDSLSHAIVVLGMHTVQSLASAMEYFQGFEQRSQGLQRLMIRSMLSAHVASATADLGKSPRREEVYLAGMFLNLGEVLVAHHSPVQHAAIRARIAGGLSAAEASVLEVGFTYDQLATAVSHHWNLSPDLASVWDSDAAPTDLAVLARFGNELTRLMCLGASETGGAGTRHLLLRYGRRLALTADGLVDIWERALEDAGATFASLGVGIDPFGAPIDTSMRPSAARTGRT